MQDHDKWILIIIIKIEKESKKFFLPQDGALLVLSLFIKHLKFPMLIQGQKLNKKHLISSSSSTSTSPTSPNLDTTIFNTILEVFLLFLHVGSSDSFITIFT